MIRKNPKQKLKGFFEYPSSDIKWNLVRTFFTLIISFFKTQLRADFLKFRFTHIRGNVFTIMDASWTQYLTYLDMFFTNAQNNISNPIKSLSLNNWDRTNIWRKSFIRIFQLFYIYYIDSAAYFFLFMMVWWSRYRFRSIWLVEFSCSKISCPSDQFAGI